MTDVVLMIGPIEFRDFEVPSGITFGGVQRLAVHRLVGGAKVIDVLGGDDAQIVFSGIFSGPNATWRARTLDAIRTAGAALPFTWDVFFYTVIIDRFQADYCNGWWIPYRITCTVLRDESGVLIPTIVPLAAAVLADIAMAAGQALDGGLDISPLQSAFALPEATVRGTVGYNLAQYSLAGASAAIDTAVSSSESTFVTSDPSQATSPGDGADRLMRATGTAGQLSALTTARSYTGRAAVNLANAST